MRVTGIGEYKSYYDLGFMIVPQKAVIEKVTPGHKILTAGFVSQQDSGIDGYVLSCSDKTTGDVKSVDVGKDQTSAKITGLKAGNAYSVTLKAYVNNPDTKAANPLSIKGKTATVGYADVKNKAQTLAVTKVISFTKKGQGTMSYTKASGNANITINKKTGAVTVKKGLAKGTYKVKVKVKAAGNAKYKASAVKTVTFTVVVK